MSPKAHRAGNNPAVGYGNTNGGNTTQTMVSGFAQKLIPVQGAKMRFRSSSSRLPSSTTFLKINLASKTNSKQGGVNSPPAVKSAKFFRSARSRYELDSYARVNKVTVGGRNELPDPKVWNLYKYVSPEVVRRRRTEREEGRRVLVSSHPVRRNVDLPRSREVVPRDRQYYPNVDSFPSDNFAYRKLTPVEAKRVEAVRRRSPLSHLLSSLGDGEFLSAKSKAYIKELWDKARGPASVRERKVRLLWRTRGDQPAPISPNFGSEDDPASKRVCKNLLKRAERSQGNPRTTSFIDTELAKVATGVSQKTFVSLAAAIAPTFFKKNKSGITLQGATTSTSTALVERDKFLADEAWIYADPPRVPAPMEKLWSEYLGPEYKGARVDNTPSPFVLSDFSSMMQWAFKAATGKELNVRISDLTLLYVFITTEDRIARAGAVTSLLESGLMVDITRLFGPMIRRFALQVWDSKANVDEVQKYGGKYFDPHKDPSNPAHPQNPRNWGKSREELLEGLAKEHKKRKEELKAKKIRESALAERSVEATRDAKRRADMIAVRLAAKRGEFEGFTGSTLGELWAEGSTNPVIVLPMPPDEPLSEPLPADGPLGEPLPIDEPLSEPQFIDRAQNNPFDLLEGGEVFEENDGEEETDAYKHQRALRELRRSVSQSELEDEKKRAQQLHRSRYEPETEKLVPWVEEPWAAPPFEGEVVVVDDVDDDPFNPFVGEEEYPAMSPDDKLHHEGLGDEFIRFLKRIQQADVFKQGGVFLLSAIALGILDNPVVAYIASSDAVKQFMEAFHQGSILIDLMTAATKMVSRIVKFAQSGDINDLFPDDSIEGIMLHGEYLLAELNSIGVSNHDPTVPMEEALRFCIKHGSNTSAPVRKLVGDLIAQRNGLLKSRCGERPAPFGIIVHGSPGTGKTYFAKTFGKYVSIEQKVPVGVPGVFEYNTTNYQDVPRVVACTLVNDALSTKAESRLTKEDPVLFLQTLVDIFPVKVESASVEDKANSYLFHSAVVVTTNVDSYFCSESSSGVDKLDRRYFVATMTYDWDKIRETVGVDAFNRRKAEGYSFIKDYIIYTVGRMQNFAGPDVKVLNLMPKNDLKVFKHFDAFFAHVRGLYDASRAAIKPDIAMCTGCARKLAAVSDPCDCKLFSTKRNVKEFEAPAPYQRTNLWTAALGEWEAFRAVYNTLTGDPREIIHQGTTPLVGMNVPDDVSIGINEIAKTIKERVDQGFNINVNFPFFERVFGTETVLSYTLKVVSLIGAISLGVKVVEVMMKWLPYATFQGSIMSVTNVPKVFNPVQPFKKNVNPWLNPDQSGGYCEIENLDTQRRMHAVLLTTRTIMFPAHLVFVSGPRPGVYGGPPMDLVIEFGSHGAQDVRLEPGTAWVGPVIGEDAVMIMYVPNLKLPLVEVFSKAHSGDAPVGPFEIGNKECEIVRADGTTLEYVASLGEGSCGLPIYDSRGVFYGMHHAIAQKPLPNGKPRSIGLFFTRRMFTEAQRALRARGCILYSQAEPPIFQHGEMYLNRKFAGTHTPHPSSDLGKLLKFEGEKPFLDARHIPLGYFPRTNVPKMTCMETVMYPVLKHKVEEMGKPYVGKAKLVNGVWNSPDLIRLRNMSVGCKYSHTAAEKAKLDYFLRFDYSFFVENPVGPLSDYQSFVGDPRNSAMNSKDPTKSIGPYLQSLGLRKEEVFKRCGDGVYEVNEALLEQMKGWELHLSSDEPLQAPSVVATLKDEAYPIAKVRECKARYFYVLDAAVNLVYRKYLLPIMAFLVAQPEKSRMYTMINASGVDFDRLYRTLSRHGVDRAFDLDQKGMDVHNQVFWETIASLCADIAIKLGYSPKDAYMVERCILSLKATILTMNDNLFYSWAYLPSGCAFTIFFNCLCGELLLASIYYGRNPHAPPGTFEGYFQTAHVGDDVVATVSPDCEFDPQTFQNDALRWGYEVTDGRKNPTVKLGPLTDISFLKRTFSKKGDRVVGPLAKQSIYKALAYCTGIKPKDQKAQDERNIGALRSQLRECVLHDEATYNEILDIASAFYPEEMFPTYSMLEEELLYGDYVTWVSLPIGKTRIGQENASL